MMFLSIAALRVLRGSSFPSASTYGNMFSLTSYKISVVGAASILTSGTRSDLTARSITDWLAARLEKLASGVMVKDTVKLADELMV